MKRILSLLAIIAVASSLTACGGSSPDESLSMNKAGKEAAAAAAAESEKGK